MKTRIEITSLAISVFYKKCLWWASGLFCVCYWVSAWSVVIAPPLTIVYLFRDWPTLFNCMICFPVALWLFALEHCMYTELVKPFVDEWQDGLSDLKLRFHAEARRKRKLKKELRQARSRQKLIVRQLAVSACDSRGANDIVPMSS